MRIYIEGTSPITARDGATHIVMPLRSSGFKVYDVRLNQLIGTAQVLAEVPHLIHAHKSALHALKG